jgi:hypothetical protein
MALRKTKLVRKPRSAMDYDFLLQMQEAINGLLNGTMTNGKVHYGAGRTIWENFSTAGVPFSGVGPPAPATLPSGITFIAGPSPNFASLYVDITVPTSAVLYLCMTGGSSATSVWAQFSGGGGNYAGTWNAGNAYAAGTIVRVTAAVNYNAIGGGNVASTVGVFGCIKATTPQGGLEVDPNQIPQFPEPSPQTLPPGIVYWECISLAIQPISVCVGGNKTIYIQSSQPF